MRWSMDAHVHLGAQSPSETGTLIHAEGAEPKVRQMSHLSVVFHRHTRPDVPHRQLLSQAIERCTIVQQVVVLSTTEADIQGR
jgi:hypothetical protein